MLATTDRAGAWSGGELFGFTPAFCFGVSVWLVELVETVDEPLSCCSSEDACTGNLRLVYDLRDTGILRGDARPSVVLGEVGGTGDAVVEVSVLCVLFGVPGGVAPDADVAPRAVTDPLLDEFPVPTFPESLELDRWTLGSADSVRVLNAGTAEAGAAAIGVVDVAVDEVVAVDVVAAVVVAAVVVAAVVVAAVVVAFITAVAFVVGAFALSAPRRIPGTKGFPVLLLLLATVTFLSL